MDRCPVCRAKLRSQPQCRRCKSDLTPLITLEKQAESARHRAVHALAAGKLDQADRLCRYAAKTCQTNFDQVLSGFVAILRN